MHPSVAPIQWSLSGLPDDVALSSAGGRLWAAASTQTLATEEVWLGEVTADAVRHVTAVREDGVCCRPAVAALDEGGALAVACAPDRRIVAVHVDAAGTPTRWELATDGVPVHLAAASHGERVHLAIELARGRARRILALVVEPATGRVLERHELGDEARWYRWPALVVGPGGVVVAWCEGPALAPGTVRLARWGRWDAARDVSQDPGEAPALAPLADGRVVVAWHWGGATAANDGRDDSVVRAIDVAFVPLDRGAESRDTTRGGGHSGRGLVPPLSIVMASPPAGAGGLAPRGEDQGWELPAVCCDPASAIWLVGRSTHGHHVARRGPDGAWTAPMPLDEGGWGGRGRRHALALHAGTVWLARRAPAGVEIGPCPPPSTTRTPTSSARPSPRLRSSPRRANAGPTVWFGDLHQHTAHSDGCGSFEDLWIAARDRRGLDFAAITDHDQFCRRALGPGTWQLATEICAGFDEPGRFTALAAYEFTGPRHPGPGHKCVYFGDRVPARVPDKNVDALFALLREVGGVAVPHHVGWTGGDFPHHDPAVQPVWEICSVHGCYEGEGGCAAHPPRADHVIPGQFVRDALAAGLRFGFIGSTDSHGLDWHHGIARWRNPFRAGLACVVGAELSREGILEALRARRSYATTGAKIGVRVELDGAPMGSELPAGTRGELLVEVTGTAPITNIVLVDARGERPVFHGPAERAAAVRVPVPAFDEPGYVYVRVEQADREAAWISPFWIG